MAWGILGRGSWSQGQLPCSSYPLWSVRSEELLKPEPQARLLLPRGLQTGVPCKAFWLALPLGVPSSSRPTLLASFTGVNESHDIFDIMILEMFES